MAELVALLIGALLFGLGLWILLLRVSGFYDFIYPHNMSIGQMTVDGAESKVHAELLRARFNHHFRRPVSLLTETGFLEAATLDTPELFQPKGVEGTLQNMTVEVSGVNVTKIVQFVNQLAAPDQWVVEGDFQTQPDRALLALRLRRGERLIRTWYLERFKSLPYDDKSDKSADKSMLLQALIDDAIFQLVYDFVNPADQNPDLRKWRSVIKNPPDFPGPAAVAAYYEAQGALGRYYARGDWRDLDVAVDRLRDLRGQMPKFEDGLRLLGMALAEQRAENEAIHVYEQLELLMQSREKGGDKSKLEDKRTLLYVQLLKATAKAKIPAWRSAHDAIRELSQIAEKVDRERKQSAAMPGMEQAAYGELLAQTEAQLAYTYAQYLDYLRHSPVAEVFGNDYAPPELRITDPKALAALAPGPQSEEAKRIVRETVTKIESQYEHWLGKGWNEESALDKNRQWAVLADGERRRAELISRLRLASGYANYRMAEWERHVPRKADTKTESLFGETFRTRLDKATKELRAADAAHPNHYLVLQLLGLVSSEPRDETADLSIAEQYFDRAIRAKPTDYFGHELLAGIVLRRVVNKGVDLGSRDEMLHGLAAAQKAVDRLETSGRAHLLRAEYQTLLLEVEKDVTKRLELRVGLEQYLDQAARFLPEALGMDDPDLSWLRVVDATRRLGEGAEALPAAQGKPDAPAPEKQRRFDQSKAELSKRVEKLINDCEELEKRWVAQQRVFQIEQVRKRATRLLAAIAASTPDNWHEIKISFQ